MWIEKYLKTFNEPALGGLYRSALNHTIEYQNSTKCLRAHHQYGYSYETGDRLARGAEMEFFAMAPTTNRSDDLVRCLKILPLIEAELRSRSAVEPVPIAAVSPAAEEELVAV